jgi:hypothetical protein
MPIVINNATIKLHSNLVNGAITLGEDSKYVSFAGCNISGGSIDSYYRPRFIECFLQNVVADQPSYPTEEGGPTFISCRLDNIKVPVKSEFAECAGDKPKYSTENMKGAK